MLKEILQTNSIVQVEKIIHIADVHIRNYKRHDEYRSVFKKLYDFCKLKVEENKNTIIYLAGDIVHSKTDMTPELIDLVTEFLDTLSRIAPTILIAGNHDCNLNNRSRMDALSPIVSLIDSDFNNLFYLKETGVYTLKNIDFVLNSVYEKPENFISPDDIEGDNTKIVLFHGAIDMASTDMGTFMKNKSLTMEKFDGFDYGMFGDIHKFQYLDVDCKFAYAGSLIQQNFGEGLNHGIIEWDIKNGKSKFIEIKNDWSFHTIEVEDGKIKKDSSNYSKNNIVRIKSTNTSNSDLFNIITDIKTKINVIDIRVQRVSNKLTSANTQTKNIIGDIRDIEYQNKLIKNFVKTGFNVTDEILNKIEEINVKINTKLKDTDIVRNVVWQPIKFEFDNMFSYGEGNVIHFEGMNGIYGLFAPNASGKSSILDALMFCLFDKCSRTFKASQVMNNRQNSFKCKLHFMIGEVDYYIERTATRDKKGNAKVIVNFYYIKDGDKQSLNGEDRDGTNFTIRKYIGTYDDFILTAMSVQGNNTNFVDKAQRERKDLLAQFLDLDLFEELNSIAGEEVKEVQALIKEFSKQDYSTKIANSRIKYKECFEKMDELTSQKDYLQKNAEEINDQLVQLNKELITLEDIDDEDKIEDLQEKIETHRKKIVSINEEMMDIELDLVRFGNKSNQIDKNISELNEEELVNKKQHLDEKTKFLSQRQSDLSNAQLKLDHCLKKIENLTNHEYDPNCPFCVNNVFVKDAEDAKRSLWGYEQDRDELKLEVKYLKDEIDSQQSVYDLIDKLEKYKKEKSETDKFIISLEKTLLDIKEEKGNLEKSLVDVKNKLEKIEQNKLTVENNIIVKNKISVITDKKQNIIKEIKSLEDDIIETSGDLKINEKVITECEKSIEKLKELEKEFYAYDYYLKAVNRNGVPYQLISEALPRIQNETNNILDQIVDFQVLFDTDGKSINTYIVYDDDRFWPLELSSGMEKFISSLAIRNALVQVSSLPRPNFIAIDEGLGVMDPNVLTNFSLFLEYLKTQFDFVILISHIDVVKDIVDNQIEIKKENGYSKIDA
jgi:DNA repair exonuclease SbcCD ATPase subunit/DNA repair exonuclease SbcCD nuclease subunit